MSIKFCEIILMVKDYDRAVKFYEALFEQPIVETRYKNRWASPIGQLSLINPDFDVHFGAPHTSDSEHVVYGNNAIVTLLTDDIEQERERIIRIGGQEVSPVCAIHYRTPYQYFHFRDTEGNVIEIGNYP